MARPRSRKPPRRLNEEELYSYAVQALAARARSIGEMRRLLARRAAAPENTAAVLARLRERGYLNDQAFAELFAGARRDNQRLGRARVVRDLRARYVAPAVAEGAVRKAYEEVDEGVLLREHIERKLRRHTPPDTPQKVASLYRSLRRAGFAHAAVLGELRRLRADPEVLDGLVEDPETSGEEGEN